MEKTEAEGNVVRIYSSNTAEIETDKSKRLAEVKAEYDRKFAELNEWRSTAERDIRLDAEKKLRGADNFKAALEEHNRITIGPKLAQMDQEVAELEQKIDAETKAENLRSQAGAFRERSHGALIKSRGFTEMLKAGND